MNKFYAIIIMLLGINSGMNITSHIWSPKPDKIPMAIFYAAIAIVVVMKIKETQEKANSDKDDERSVTTEGVGKQKK